MGRTLQAAPGGIQIRSTCEESMTRTIVAAAAALLLGTTGGAAAQATATAELIDRDGNRTGEVRLTQTPGHGVLLRIEASGLEPGTVAIHIHETGRCDAPTFESAGGHFNPVGVAHGALHPDGMHAGDLLNLHIPESGRIETERHARLVTLDSGWLTSLLDGDGAAVVIHAGADDYMSQPTGDAGGRVACGVIRRSP
jgi:superoxide dismutase, Cu-Zn family